MPEDKAQENFTDPHSRIIKRASAGFGPAYNAQTAVDEVAHIIVALGREGKEHAEIDAQRYPQTAAMAAKLKTERGRAAYRKRKWIAEPPNGWIKNALGLRQFSMRGRHRVRAEWKLVCKALNLRRMAVLGRWLSSGKGGVKVTGASLAEGGWRERSNELELPHGGGSGERCVKAAG